MISSKVQLSVMNIETGELIGESPVSNVTELSMEDEGSFADVIEAMKSRTYTFNCKWEDCKIEPSPYPQSLAEELNGLLRRIHSPATNRSEKRKCVREFKRRFKAFDEYCKKNGIQYEFKNINMEEVLPKRL